MFAGFEVPESAGDLKAVVDSGAAAALPWYLPVFESCDDVFDAGPDPAVGPVVVIADYPISRVGSWRGDRWDAAVAAVAKDLVAGR